MTNCELSGGHVGRHERLTVLADLDWLHLERSGAVLSERPYDSVQADQSLRLIESSNLNEDIFCVDGDLR